MNEGEKYLAAFGEDSEIHKWMAVSLHSMGRRKEAEFHYRRAIELGQPDAAGDTQCYATVFFRQEGKLDEADQLALKTIDEVEAKLMRSPNGFFLRSYLGTAYGLIGDLARLREEEARVQREFGDASLDLSGLADAEGMIGDKKRFVELRRVIFRAGNVDLSSQFLRVLFADPNLEDYPGYNEFAAEAAAEIRRLEALY